MMGKIFSPGKLLLTSEYVVLDGALALAVPTKQGQEFFFEEIQDSKSTVIWEAYHQEKLWFKAEIDYQNWIINNSTLQEPAEFILKVLKNVQKLSSLKFQSNDSYYLNTNLQFPPDFGLGSSSTLMNNLAEWSSSDAFQLNDLSLGGSGYDIAVAKEQSPILFQISEGNRIFSNIEFNPNFKNELIFIHLNQKQNSREGINLYRSKDKSQKLIDEFSKITEAVLQAKNIETFSELMIFHEAELSSFLNLTTVKENYFQDCPVFVKSLGAWGGDFVMSRKFDGFEAYFSEREYHSVFGWEDIIR